LEYLFLKNVKNPFLLFLFIVTIGGCNGIFYHPTPDILITPQRLNYSYEEVSFKSLDGTGLNGWFIPGRGTIRGTIILYHGNAENISNHYGAVYWLPDEGFNVFLFDYRGYGKSRGAPTRKGIQEDGIAALEYIRQRADVLSYPIIIYGQSLGGAVAVSTVANQKHDGIRLVILESSFTGYRNIAREKLGSLWLTWPLQWPLSFLISNEYSPLDLIRKISPVPLLIVHGDSDEIIPFHHSQELYQAARKPKTLWIIPGGHHIDAFSPSHKDNRKKLIEFLDHNLKN
jgi:fermentation-respiration switch protein FrsA (DUF1100 family)